MDMTDRRRERLRWRCSRRGMLELDLILTGVFERHYDHFTDIERDLFEQLIALEDTNLLACFQGTEEPPSVELKQLVIKLKQ